MTREGSAPRLSRVIGRIHFLAAVGLVAAHFFKAGNEDKCMHTHTEDREKRERVREWEERERERERERDCFR